jgi:thymidylate synthase (FAD)
VSSPTDQPAHAPIKTGSSGSIDVTDSPRAETGESSEGLAIETRAGMSPSLAERRVLDAGFMRLVDFMGGDVAVVQAARVSYGQGSKGPEKDRKLIHFLMKNHHDTPFEMALFKFHVKCPIFVARQWFRHRWSSFNEISGRYTELAYEFYLPERVRRQMAKNYEFEESFDDAENARLRSQLDAHFQRSFALYAELLEKGVAKEEARIVLPLSLYTEFYWGVNARALMNFLRLRAERHAQYEIRVYAEAALEMFRERMPWTCEAFESYVMPGAPPEAEST